MPKDKLDGEPTSADLDMLRESAEDAPSIPALLKSGNWDKRLAEARVRRAAVLAAREAEDNHGGIAKTAGRWAAPVVPWRPAAFLAVGALMGAAVATWALRGEASLTPPASAILFVQPSTLAAVPSVPLGSPSVVPLDGAPRLAALAPERFQSSRSDAPPVLGAEARPPPRTLIRAAGLGSLPDRIAMAPVSRRAWPAVGLGLGATPALADPYGSDSPPVLAPDQGAGERGLGDMRLVVFAPSSLGDSAIAPTLETLQGLGLPVNGATEVNLRIRDAHLRVYHDADRAAAERVADATGATLRDFTAFTPAPPPGTVEFWLAGNSRVTPQPVRSLKSVLPPPADPRARRIKALVARFGGDGLSAAITERRVIRGGTARRGEAEEARSARSDHRDGQGSGQHAEASRATDHSNSRDRASDRANNARDRASDRRESRGHGGRGGRESEEDDDDDD